MIAPLLVVALAPVGHSQSSSPVRENPVLELDGSRIAAYGLSGDAWRTESIPASQVRPWPIGNWVIAELSAADSAPLDENTEAATWPHAASQDLQIRQRVERLANSDPEAFVSPVFFGSDGGPVIVTPVLLVRFEVSHRGQAALDTLATQPSLEILAEDWAGMSGAYKLAVDTTNAYDVLDIAAQLEATEGVRFAEPDWIFTGRGSHTPNDPEFVDQWGLHNTGQSGGVVDMDVNAPAAWDVTLGSASIEVLVIDTGVQQDHPDINQLPGVDVTSEGPGTGGPVNGFDRHGTPVAGCVSATIDNSLGITGMAPNCPSVSARTFISVNLQGNWTSQASWTVDALAHAESIGAEVTNNSNFYGFTSSAIDDKYAETRESGMVHFSAAGNQSSSTVTYPADLPSVQCIGSIDRTGALSTFSNFGTALSVVAPGTTIRCTDRTGSDGYHSGDFVTLQGTSFASPICAGVAALMISRNNALGPQEVEDLLHSTTKDLGAPGYDSTFGWGLVDAHAAVAAANPCFLMGTFCVGLPNSASAGATIDYTGSSSISTNDLVLLVDDCPASVVGLFFYGPDQVNLPLADGLRCVGGAITRLSPRVTTGLGSVSESLNLTNAPFTGGNGQAVPGESMNFQFWYRDQAAGGAGSNLSNALRVTFCN